MTNPPAVHRILFVTPVLPEHASGGGRTATVEFLALLRSPAIGAEVEVAALRESRAVLPHRARQVLALLRSSVSGLPSKSLFEGTAAALARIRGTLSRRHDLAFINGGDLFFLAREMPAGQPCIGFSLNVEADLYAQQTRPLRRRPLVGRFLERDLAKLRRVETQGLEQLSGIVCLSTDDAARLREIAPRMPILALPTSFSYRPHRRSARAISRPLRLGFLAKFGWWPNAEGVEWLIREVLPALRPGRVEVHLFGPGSERFAAAHPAIVAHGFVDDLARAWTGSDVMVCPIFSGSGINVKLVESIYNGCPVLATSHALRGLPPLEGPAVVRLDTAAQWSEFLDGPGAEALAGRTQDADVSALFSAEAAAPRLAEFIARVRERAAEPARG